MLNLNKQNGSLIQTMNTNEEIRDSIRMVNTFMLCCELILTGEIERYSFRILSGLKESGLYKHNLKKYSNIIRDINHDLQIRSNRSDMDIVLKQYEMAIPSGKYKEEYHEEGGNILQRLVLQFKKEHGEKLTAIERTCRALADIMCPKHAELLSDIYALQALAQTDIEVYDECQKQIANIGRMRLKSYCIKSKHSEQMVNAAKNLTDYFVPRNAYCPSQEVLDMRQSIYNFQRSISDKNMFMLMESSFLSLKMDIIEYYLAKLRLDLKWGKIAFSSVKDLYFRLGDRWNVRELISELRNIPVEDPNIPVRELMQLMLDNSDENMMNKFRSISVNQERMEPDTQRILKLKGLKRAATENSGILPDKLIGDIARAFRTKKEMLDFLRDAGPRLHPTLYRVQATKILDLKQL